MLKTRVITAIIVAPLALAALLLLEPTPFRAFIAIVLGVCAWEWANFAYLQQPGRVGFAVAVGLLTFFAPPDVNWLWIGLGLWSFTALLVLRFPKFPLILKRPAINLLVGVGMLVPAGVALRILNSQAAYPEYLVLLLGLVWCADIGAYFAGRRFGRTKLHRAVSPGKSWAGVYGGLLVTLVFSGVWLGQVIGIEALSLMGGLAWILFVIVMVFVSILGDLSLSMYKRVRDVKDSSQLLPGHGGFLDRLDSLLSVAPVMVLAFTLAGWPV